MLFKRVIEPNDPYLLSYKELRITLGVLGLLLPFILMVGGFLDQRKFIIEPSISDYYATVMGDVFVGILIAIALFFYTYRYDKKDSIAGNIAGVSAACVALFPTTSDVDWIRYLHLGAAGLFFCTLVYFNFFFSHLPVIRII